MPVKKTSVKAKPTKKTVKPVKKVVSKKTELVSLEKLLESGAHFGHQAKRWNPKMSEYLYGVEDGVHVFDLIKTKKCLENALAFLKESKKEGKIILLLGTKKQAQEKIKEIGVATNTPYIIERFLGGTFTNFEQIKKSIKKMIDMKESLRKGEYADYTKKEKLLMAREIADLEKKFSGIANLTKLPDIIFIVDTHKEFGAVTEARKKNIKIVGLVDSNADPNIDFPIPMNDDAVKALDYVLDLIKIALS
ncbi:MAG TPA: 30S ribosomal protein S2 [Candidatus Saccharimonadales bacterium]|nr:30S ribosomal protein S2 [Candidatus Saccharimonadales bacterium]